LPPSCDASAERGHERAAPSTYATSLARRHDPTSTTSGCASCQAVEQDPERYSGAWVFRGTRVPVAALFENLEDDVPVHRFVEWFPGVTREQACAVLVHAGRSADGTLRGILKQAALKW
jgi:uncharacterized protein (DUF433 family)